MTRRSRLGCAAAALAAALPALSACGTAQARGTTEVTLVMRWSRFDQSNVEVRRGVPVRFVYVNDDPIAHEVLVGDAAFHERHEKGTEQAHGHRPDETDVPANTTRETTLTFDTVGTLHFACHLPGHYAYGMKGTVTVVP